jgi:hypothetical protein
MGKMADEDLRLEEQSSRALEIVRATWPFMGVAEIVDTITARCPGVVATPCLVWALKRRIDNQKKSGAK